jgi:hypothetical protein
MTRLLILVLLCILVAFHMFGCADKHADCVEIAQREYSNAHPETSYSQLILKRQDFERRCPQ